MTTFEFKMTPRAYYAGWRVLQRQQLRLQWVFCALCAVLATAGILLYFLLQDVAETAILPALSGIVAAMAVLLPEKEFDMQHDILDKITETQRTGKRHFIVIVAEGIGHSQEIANEIQARTGIDTRATILGHVQRGGSPTLRDRVNASAMGYHAVCLLEQGKYNRIVGMKGEHLVDYPVDEALEMTKTLDPVLIDVCNTISI